MRSPIADAKRADIQIWKPLPWVGKARGSGVISDDEYIAYEEAVHALSSSLIKFLGDES